jgi:hypothetical protein
MKKLRTTFTYLGTRLCAKSIVSYRLQADIPFLLLGYDSLSMSQYTADKNLKNE